MKFDLEKIRSQFPALAITDEGRSRVYLDNPAGTQVPLQVIDRMRDYLIQCNANQGGHFSTSLESDRILEEAHQAMADLLHARSSSEIIFGANMTTLTYAMSRSRSPNCLAITCSPSMYCMTIIPIWSISICGAPLNLCWRRMFRRLAWRASLVIRFRAY